MALCSPNCAKCLLLKFPVRKLLCQNGNVDDIIRGIIECLGYYHRTYSSGGFYRMKWDEGRGQNDGKMMSDEEK